MSTLKAQLAWLVKGGASTRAALDAYGDGLRALQEKVARIDAELQQLRSTNDVQAAEAARLAGEVAGLEGQLRAAVDDLGDRLGHLSQRLG